MEILIVLMIIQVLLTSYILVKDKIKFRKVKEPTEEEKKKQEILKRNFEELMNYDFEQAMKGDK